MPFDLWDILPGAYLLLAGCAAVAALWPPLSRRRLAMALTLLAGATAAAFTTFSPTINLPTHFVVVAECKAFANRAAFEGSLSAPLGDRPFLSEVTYRVLSDPQCEGPDPARGAVSVDGNSLGSAMAAARQAFETTPFYLQWRANRIVLLGVPGGRLSHAREKTRGSNDEEEARKYLALIRSFQATVEYHAIDATPDQRLSVSAPLWRATPAGKNSSALRLEFTADRIGDANSIKLDITQHVRLPSKTKPGCEVQSRSAPEETPVRGIDRNMLNGAGDQGDELRVEWPDGRSGRRLIVTMAYLDLIADNISQDDCDSWWSFVDIAATVSWPQGDVTFHGGTAMGRGPEPMLTLYTPSPGSAADRHAAAGWEMGAADLVTPDPAWGVTTLLDAVRQEKNAKAAVSKERALRSPWRTLWRSFDLNCWFTGPEYLRAHQDTFRSCLDKSRRLVVVSPTADDIQALETVDVQKRVASGALHTLVTAPEYAPAETSGLPAWAVPATPMLLPTVSIPLVVASPTANGLIIRGAGAKPNLQETVLENLAAPSVAGNAEAGASCAATSEPINTRRGLFWLALQSPLVPVPPVLPTTPTHPQIRLRGLLETVAQASPIFPKYFDDNPATNKTARGRLGSAGSFEDNLQCDNPVKRTIDVIVQLERSGLYHPGTGRVPRAAVLLFDTNQPVPGTWNVPNVCNNGDPGRYASTMVKSRLSAFAAAGGHIFVQPIVPSINFEPRLYEDATKYVGGGLPPVEATQLLRNQLSPELANAVAPPLPPIRADDDPAAAARNILGTIESNWNVPLVADGLVAESVDYGSLGTRNAACALDPAGDLPRIRYHCLYTPASAGRRPFANALTRAAPAPEFFTPFGTRPEDKLTSGQLQLGDGRVLRQIVQIGRGRSVILGYSPFARDQLALDFFETPESPRLKRGLCFLTDGGTSAVYNRAVTSDDKGSGIFPRDGGMKLLDRFAQILDLPLDAPLLDTITDRDPATGAFTLVAYAQPQYNSTWTWQLRLTPADAPGTAFAPGTEPASLILQSFDPGTGEARIRVEPRIPGYHGAVALSLSEPPAGPPVVLPLVFPQPLSTIDLTKIVELLNTSRSSSARLTLDTSAALVPALIICALAMFSPMARSWAAAGTFLDRWWRRILPEANLPSRAAPLFALEAALSEWGAHPGQPAAARNAGLPAGVRQWRAGDVGRAIIPASLYGLLGSGAAVPPMKPKVRLKTASQATSVLVLLEGTGALHSPRARNAPAKSDFAATLAAFLAGATTMSHGRAEVARVGLEAVLTGDPIQLRSDIQTVLDYRPSFISPTDFLRQQGNAALVFFIIDGLSVNERDLVAMADVLAVDGNRLRVAAIVSDDDRYGATLSRDPRNGAFEDASEIHPMTFLRLRDQRLEAARFELDRRGAQLVVLSAESTTQELLRRLDETGFLT